MAVADTAVNQPMIDDEDRGFTVYQSGCAALIGLPLPAQRKHLKRPDVSGLPTQQLASARQLLEMFWS